ncbi:MAG: S8 family serine peptidase [Thermodesulfobacteriota bacterium]
MSFFRHTVVALITASLLLTGPVLCQAATMGRQLQASLGTAAPNTELPVLITFSDKVDPRSFISGSPRQRRDELVRAMRGKAKDTQQPLKDFLQTRGVRNIKSLWIINGLAIDARPELIKTISQWPGVAEIRTNGTITVPEVSLQAVGTSEWNIAAVGAEQLWNMGLTGAGVVVATLDSGVDGAHPELQGKWRGWNGVPCDPLINTTTRDWFDPYGEHQNCPYDRDGHGTAVMGIIAGGDGGGTAIGTAPDATWIAAKIFNDADSASYDAIHSAFQWVLDPDGNGDTSDAPDIVNNSWGLNGVNQCTDEFQADIQLLKTAGIAVVFSGGNTGPDPSSSSSPGNYPESIAVGSTDQTGDIAFFSGRGPSPCPSADPIFPQLVAPGVGIKTTDLSFGGVIPGSYTFVDGTSFSAPHVSGIMALLLGAGGFPATTIQDLEIALELSATDLGAEGVDNDFGYGQINARAAANRLAGLPHLAVYDTKPPEHDRVLDFGSIPVGMAVIHPVVIRNSGGGVLTLALNDWSALNPSFTVISDTCSGVDLLSDEDCRLMVQFSPTGDGVFNEALSFSSNDTEQNPIIVSLAGTGNLDPLPPQIEVSAEGQVLAFGSVPPGSTFDKLLTISNSGEEFLLISQIDSGSLPTQFSITTDNCTGASLAINESCNVIFSFAPDFLKTFQASVAIISSDPDQNRITVSLTGTGNNPPNPALLISPPNGSVGLGTTVTFKWQQPADPDGDLVTDKVLIAESTPAAAGIPTMSTVNFPGSGLPAKSYIPLCLALLLIISFRKKPRIRFFTILAAGIILLNSCGGGGGGSPATNSSFTTTGLKSGTTYSWKVVSQDGGGGATESSTWSFTTK